MSDERIRSLKAEYADLHYEAVRRIDAGATDAELDDLERREMEIAEQLRKLGSHL